MAIDDQIPRVLRVYGEPYRALVVQPIRSDSSFSGAQLWRIETARGAFALRSWKGHPDRERLGFIQAVLWHVDQEGFHRVPLPIETPHHHGHVWHAGQLWDLSHWLPGIPLLVRQPDTKLIAHAMVALAEFHEAARSFPLAEPDPVPSHGILERLGRLDALMAADGLESLKRAVDEDTIPGLAPRARRAIDLFVRAAPSVRKTLDAAARHRVSIQPCIRDVWKAHVLFERETVSGIVDFTAMRPENVAADVARLLGSLTGDDPLAWTAGLDAYESVRRLSVAERELARAFDLSLVLLGPLAWLEWIYVERRQFERPAAVLSRFDELLGRMVGLAGA